MACQRKGLSRRQGGIIICREIFFENLSKKPCILEKDVLYINIIAMNKSVRQRHLSNDQDGQSAADWQTMIGRRTAMMKQMIKSNTKFLLFTVTVVIMNALLVMSVPIYINEQLKSSPVFEIYHMMILFAVISITFLCQLVLTYIRESYAVKFNQNNSLLFYEMMYQMKYEALIEKQPAYLIDRISMLVNSLYLFFVTSFTTISSSIILAVFSVIVAVSVHPVIGVVLTVNIPINLFGYRALNKKLETKCEKMQNDTAAGYKEIIGIYKNVDFVKKQGDFNRIRKVIDLPMFRIFNSTADVNKFAQTSSAFLRYVNNLIQNIVIVFVSIQAMNHNDYASLVMVSIVLPLYFSSLNSLVSTNLEISGLKTNMDFVKNELKLNRESTNGKDITSIHHIRMDIDGIIVGGQKLNIAAHDTFSKGDVVLVKGKSGIGKSILMKSLLRFYDSASIYMDNINLSQINPISLRKRITFVPQDAPIYSMSLKDNMELSHETNDGSLDALRQKIMEPVLIHKKPETIILENGANLSGGEKQRISLCREMSQMTDILILDESTSSIDHENSQAILGEIVKSNRDKIIFIITHDEGLNLEHTKELILSR
ncbi:MAG: ABC transporter ATP-binding protein/permease [Clostridium sp.]|jgi:subfamily B ATP-binding cassette protein MsbA|nr:ABC transporter ATP-binding protein/permease [Clostridium sp.]